MIAINIIIIIIIMVLTVFFAAYCTLQILQNGTLTATK